MNNLKKYLVVLIDFLQFVNIPQNDSLVDKNDPSLKIKLSTYFYNYEITT